MKKRGLVFNFILTMVIFSLLLVSMWVVFYFTTKRAFMNNMTAQAETISESVTKGIEDELLSVDEAAYELARYDGIIDMMSASDTRRFYDLGQAVSAGASSLIGNNCPADNVVVIRDDGLFYRLKGQMSNTAVRRAIHLIGTGDKSVIAVSTGGVTYAGCNERIGDADGNGTGYVLLLIEKSRLKELLSSFDKTEYIGVAVTAGEELICANKDISYQDLEDLVGRSALYREKAIGLTGFDLHIYCVDTVPERMGRYFRIALPLTIGMLLIVVWLFVRYWNKHIVSPIDTIIESTTDAPDSHIPLTGEEYFDDLVEHVNDALTRIEERDRQLYESDIKIKESELMMERTLMSLLKKQINAHFTVNTMSVVRALINKGDKETAAMICDELSGLLRYANAVDEYISLMDEFMVLGQYVSIMQVRYPGRFSFTAEPGDNFDEYYIPRMLLQPIVENAITHGFVGRTGKICVTADIGDVLHIVISDNGIGIPADKLKVIRDRLAEDENTEGSGLEHVALLNIRKRIRMVCGPEYGLDITSVEGEGTTVTLTLPVRTDRG